MSATSSVYSSDSLQSRIFYGLRLAVLLPLPAVAIALSFDLIVSGSLNWHGYLILWAVIGVQSALASVSLGLFTSSPQFYVNIALISALLALLFFTGWLNTSDGAAVCALVLWGVLLLQVEWCARPKWKPVSILFLLFIAVIAAAVPVAIDQIDTRFASEEYFAALSAARLCLYWLALLIGWRYAMRKSPITFSGPSRKWAAPVALMLGCTLILFAAVRAYQQSFYSTVAPQYPGVTETSPFLCAELTSAAQDRSGEQVFDDLLTALADAPDKQSPELGMLAVASGDSRWAEAFRDAILEEATSNRYVGASGSVKWAQYLAAQRTYYVATVADRFPDLFTSEEETQLETWFHAVNRRAWTLEWVDWLYALALRKLPQGVYENQESGAGLLAMLEFAGLGDPDYQQRNQAYLGDNQRGWLQRFRNTDDADVYQIEWLTNAYFQSLYEGALDLELQTKSFEWLLLQSLPDGSHPGYNHIARRSLAGPAYLAATLLQDGRYIWLADQALTYSDRINARTLAQPGVDSPIAINSAQPALGSCLLYGGSGLPNRHGPLAPDKIIFRDGWSVDSAYVLLNLRFTGWHRYKATNTLSVLYQGERLVTDQMGNGPFTWLPEGRSLFRDKRIPRENLNGLLIENSGLSGVLAILTGVGSPWAQDPPHYAEVVEFVTGAGGDAPRVDSSHTRITAWRDWRHDRYIRFYHDGPIIILDYASGPSSRQAALSWHLTKAFAQNADNPLRFTLTPSNDDRDFAIQFVPLRTSSDGRIDPQTSADGQGTALVYQETTKGALAVATVFLPDNWANADIRLQDTATGSSLLIQNGADVITTPLPQ